MSLQSGPVPVGQVPVGPVPVGPVPVGPVPVGPLECSGWVGELAIVITYQKYVQLQFNLHRT